MHTLIPPRKHPHILRINVFLPARHVTFIILYYSDILALLIIQYFMTLFKKLKCLNKNPRRDSNSQPPDKMFST